MSKPHSAHLLGKDVIAGIRASADIPLCRVLCMRPKITSGLQGANITDCQIAPLLYDTVVTFMTICKAITIRRRNGGPSSRLIQTFLREGWLHVTRLLASVDAPQVFSTISSSPSQTL